MKEPEGRLYEYLEGILLRGVDGSRGASIRLPRELAVYDLRKLGEWEDEHEEEDEEDMGVEGDASGGAQAEDEEEHDVVDEEDLASTLRTCKKFNFTISEFAVDPGQDLLVLVEIK